MSSPCLVSNCSYFFYLSIITVIVVVVWDMYLVHIDVLVGKWYYHILRVYTSIHYYTVEVKCAPSNTISCSVVDVVSFNLTFINVKRVINYFLDSSLHVGTTCLKNWIIRTKIGAENMVVIVYSKYMLFLQIKECIQGKLSLAQTFPTTRTFFSFSTRKIL